MFHSLPDRMTERSTENWLTAKSPDHHMNGKDVIHQAVDTKARNSAGSWEARFMVEEEVHNNKQNYATETNKFGW